MTTKPSITPIVVGIILLAACVHAAWEPVKLDGTTVQLQAAFIKWGYTNGFPVGITKTGWVVSNPDWLPLPGNNDIPPIAESKRIVDAWKASRVILNTTTNR